MHDEEVTYQVTIDERQLGDLMLTKVHTLYNQIEGLAKYPADNNSDNLSRIRVTYQELGKLLYLRRNG